MPRKPRLEYPGAMCHAISRGSRREGKGGLGWLATAERLKKETALSIKAIAGAGAITQFQKCERAAATLAAGPCRDGWQAGKWMKNEPYYGSTNYDQL
jgi:hypothetical protein